MVYQLPPRNLWAVGSKKRSLVSKRPRSGANQMLFNVESTGLLSFPALIIQQCSRVCTLIQLISRSFGLVDLLCKELIPERIRASIAFISLSCRREVIFLSLSFCFLNRCLKCVKVQVKSKRCFWGVCVFSPRNSRCTKLPSERPVQRLKSPIPMTSGSGWSDYLQNSPRSLARCAWIRSARSLRGVPCF